MANHDALCMLRQAAGQEVRSMLASFGFWRVAPATLTLLLVASTAPLAETAGRTIVGHWATSLRDCSRASSGLRVQPMGLEGKDVRCRFSNVRRTGDTVAWSGRCEAFGEEFPATVTARSVGGHLTVDFNGSDRRGPFERCRK